MSDTKSNSSSSSGVGGLGLLGIVFVTLKLTGVIDWSWWWVTVPFWGGLAILLAVFAIWGGWKLGEYVWLRYTISRQESETKAEG